MKEYDLVYRYWLEFTINIYLQEASNYDSQIGEHLFLYLKFSSSDWKRDEKLIQLIDCMVWMFYKRV